MNIFNNLRVGTKIIFGFVTILMLMIAMGVTLSLSLDDLKNDFIFLVEHDQPVLSNAHELAKLVVDMETGERGFLITGKDEFLEPFYTGIKKFDSLIEIEKKLVSDNPPQIVLLEKIALLRDEWLKKAGNPAIAKRREANKATINAEQLQEMLKVGTGKNILDNLRNVLNQLEDHLNAKNDLESVILTIKIAKNMIDQETGERGFIITGENDFLEPYRFGHKQLEENLVTLKSRLNDVNDLALLKQVKSLSEQWIEQAAKPEIAARQKMNTNSVTMNDITTMIQAGTGKKILDEIRTHFNNFIQTEKQLNITNASNTKYDVIFMNNLTLWITVGGIIIGFLLSISISRSITRPLQKLTLMANSMAIGNMEQIVELQNQDEISQMKNRRDEMGDIGRSYDAMANYFRTIIEDIVDISQDLANGNLKSMPKAEYKGDFIKIQNALETALEGLNNTIWQTKDVIIQVTKSTAEIRTIGQILSSSTEQQSAAAEEMTSSLEETDAQVKSNAENAGVTNELVNDTANLAKTGQEKMKKMIDAMNVISSSSQEVSKTIKIIDEIAFQTNLLALNAAVEAARAGEHGRGFAVVAQEVRNLAGRSANSAKETAEMIENAKNQVQEGVNIVNDTATALIEIVQNVVKARDLVEEITAASREQSAGISQINTAMGQISEAAYNGSQQMEKMAIMADDLTLLANKLHDETSRFKLRNDSENTVPIQIDTTVNDFMKLKNFSDTKSNTNGYKDF
ncbi:CHASE3 domain-containing protein [Candidatus Halobeggiatoa sp. HSG11]|nr:CHASE3 domain-containing protein [Candidatus Halobeggiatoa sp. HSG11]